MGQTDGRTDRAIPKCPLGRGIITERKITFHIYFIFRIRIKITGIFVFSLFIRNAVLYVIVSYLINSFMIK